MNEATTVRTPERVPTGIDGLDAILKGGLIKSGIYIVTGRPGAGKTIFANQICFQAAQRGASAVYVTLLAETHGRMLSQLSPMAFFRREDVGRKVRYLSAFGEIEADGLNGLMRTLRQSVRDDKAAVLVIDGMVTAASFAKSEVDYKKFIHELQTWVSMMGCTVLILTSGSADSVRPEHTMVDGLFELTLRHEHDTPRPLRMFRCTKFRGSAFLEGDHVYRISDAGVTLFPRCETVEREQLDPNHVVSADRLKTGVPGLDAMLGGGLRRGSTTLALGSSGSGKTVLGMQFLAEGARRGERCLHFGFFETPAALRLKADRLKMPFEKWIKSGVMELQWQSPAEGVLDVLADRLLTTVREKKIERLFIDGLVGFKEAENERRIGGYLSVIGEWLTAHNVTSLISEETRQLFIDDVFVPTGGVSAAFHNILFLRQVELDATLRRLISVMKTRDSAHARALYEFDITDHGLEIGQPFAGTSHLIKGSPRGGKPEKRSRLLRRKAKR